MFLVTLLACVAAASAFSIGEPPSCTINDDFGCTTHWVDPDTGVENHLNCTDAQPGIMPWAKRPVMNNGYSITAVDGSNTYNPGEIKLLQFNVLQYDLKPRGLIIYGRQGEINTNNEMKIGSWEFPTDDEMYFAPFPEGHACHPVALHSSARLKPFISTLYWKAPAAGTGTVHMRAMAKHGDANTGAWYYVPELTLTENTNPPAQEFWKGDAGQDCDSVCQNHPDGYQFDMATHQTVSDGTGDALRAAVLPHYPCHFPLMSACDAHDPSSSWNDFCHFYDSTASCSSAQTSTATSNADTDSERFCGCIPDPCFPSPCGDRGDCYPTADVPLTEDSFFCDCNNHTDGNPAWDGPTCSNPLVHPCDQEVPVCKAGGTCNRGATGFDYTCTCPTCRFPADDCEAAPPCLAASQLDPPVDLCSGHGTCADVPNPDGLTCEHSCTCEAGWSDSNGLSPAMNCEEFDGCSPNAGFGDCNPTGTAECSDLEFGAAPNHICVCLDGWSGALCDQDKNECIEIGDVSVFCSAERGHTCVNTPGSYDCVCENAPMNQTQCYGPMCECCTVDCAPDPCENAHLDCPSSTRSAVYDQALPRPYCDCNCPDGEYQMDNTETCVEVPTCQLVTDRFGVSVEGVGLQTCAEDETCISLPGGGQGPQQFACDTATTNPDASAAPNSGGASTEGQNNDQCDSGQIRVGSVCYTPSCPYDFDDADAYCPQNFVCTETNLCEEVIPEDVGGQPEDSNGSSALTALFCVFMTLLY